MAYCKKCGKEIEEDVRYCKFCGADQFAAPIQPTVPPTNIQQQPLPTVGLETKNTGVTAVLALVLGFFGLWGVGHIYVGKLTKGIVLIIIGIFVEWVIGIFAGIGIIAILSGGSYYWRYLPGTAIGLIALWFLAIIGGWIWQVYDAYKLAKYYNQYVQQNRSPPW